MSWFPRNVSRSCFVLPDQDGVFLNESDLLSNEQPAIVAARLWILAAVIVLSILTFVTGLFVWGLVDEIGCATIVEDVSAALRDPPRPQEPAMPAEYGFLLACGMRRGEFSPLRRVYRLDPLYAPHPLKHVLEFLDGRERFERDPSLEPFGFRACPTPLAPIAPQPQLPPSTVEMTPRESYLPSLGVSIEQMRAARG